MRVSTTRKFGCLFGLMVVVLLAGIGEVREAEGQSQKCLNEWINKDPNKKAARQTQFNKCVAQRNLDQPTNVPKCGTPAKCRTYTLNPGTKMCILGWKAGDCTTHCNSNGIPDACRTNYEPGDFILKMKGTLGDGSVTRSEFVFDGSAPIQNRDDAYMSFGAAQNDAYRALKAAVEGLGRTVDVPNDFTSVVVQKFDSDPFLFSVRNFADFEMERLRTVLGLDSLSYFAKKAPRITVSETQGVSLTPGPTPSPIPGSNSRPGVNPLQWGLANAGGGFLTDYDGTVYKGQKGIDIDLMNGWAVERGTAQSLGTGTSLGRRSVVVAVIDDGFNLTSSDLLANRYINPRETPCNMIDDDKNGFIDDYAGWDAVLKHGCVGQGALSEVVSGPGASKKGHGTHVASIIAAAPSQSSASATGVAPLIRIWPIKAYSDDYGGYSTDALTEAYLHILALKKQGVPIVVVNTSYTGDCSSLGSVEAGSIISLVNAGITVVGAAGNDGKEPLKADQSLNEPYEPQCPGALGATRQDPGGVQGVISVAMSAPGPKCSSKTDKTCTGNTELHYRSNYGNTVNTAAPGTGVYANGEFRSGTSMAAPHVSGIIALMYSVNPFLRPNQVEAIISDPANSQNLSFRVRSGGLISAKSAIERAAHDVIAGKVVDPSGAGVGGVRVSLKVDRKDEEFKRAWARTDSLGFFYFPRPALGTQFEIEADGALEPPTRAVVKAQQRSRFKLLVGPRPR